MITKEILEKYGFKKTEKDRHVFSNCYLLCGLNNEYPYFNYATLEVPKYEKGGNIEYDNSQLILHRGYDYDRWVKQEWDEYYETKEVYDGLIENEEDLKFILTKTQIIIDEK